MISLFKIPLRGEIQKKTISNFRAKAILSLAALEYSEQHNFKVGDIFKFAKMYWKLKEFGSDVFAELLTENYDEVESNNVSTFTLVFRELTSEEKIAARIIER